jgi:uncharacterized protein
LKNHLIVFAKRPLAGYAKTRLGEKIGLEESAGIYARFLYQSLFELVALDRADIIIELSLASSADVPYFRFAFPEFQISSQTGGNLGQRFTKSFQKAFDQGATAVVVIGTDIPDLNRSILQSAFDALSENEVVIGPDMDGGYYLIGTRLRDATLFKNIDWSSERVFQQTERLILAQGLTMFYLPTLSDVDTDEDFRRWLAKRASQND